MLRRASLALFVLALGLAVACGRQVTPSPTFNNNLAGTIQIKFRTVGPLDFTQFNYWIVFNTSGQGGEPYAPALQQCNAKNFSYVFVVGASTGGAGTVLPVLLQFYTIPGVCARTQPFNVNPSLTSLQPNSNGQGTEFTLTFARSQLALPPPTQPTGTPSPSSSPSASPKPTPSPTGSAQPSSAPTPQSSPTAASQSTWFVNLFTTDNANPPHVLDALGFGATDQTFSAGQFDVNSQDQLVWQQPTELNPPANSSAQLQGFELVNTP
jgi:hypothetical protein